jgi:hypothetical protein
MVEKLENIVSLVVWIEKFQIFWSFFGAVFVGDIKGSQRRSGTGVTRVPRIKVVAHHTPR